MAFFYPNYSKHIDTHRTDTETEDDYNEDIDECHDDLISSCSASVDDEDIETPNNISKIKSIFQILCYTIHRGKMKTPLHFISSSAIYEKSKIRGLLTS